MADNQVTLEPELPATLPSDAHSRFMSQVSVEPNSGCWLWTGCDNGQGYGRFYINGQQWRAHRLSVILDGRAIPAGMVVDHTCRTRICVNPEHLRVVTPKTNTLENSNAFPAKFFGRAACSRGHRYTKDSMFVRMRGTRQVRVCRICQRLYDRKWKLSAKATLSTDQGEG